MTDPPERLSDPGARLESSVNQSTVHIWSEYKQDLPTDDAILSYAYAKTAFENLVNAGVNGRELLSRIRVIVLLTRLPWLRTTDWAEGSGKTVRTLRAFPERLLGIADEIAGVEKHGLLFPPSLFPPFDPPVSQLIHNYAILLAARISEVSAGVAALNRDREMGQKLLVHLCNWIKEATGKYAEDDVSLLVTAAHVADGREKDISSEALKVLHSPDRRHVKPPRIVEASLDNSARTIALTIEIEGETSDLP